MDTKEADVFAHAGGGQEKSEGASVHGQSFGMVIVVFFVTGEMSEKKAQ
jgi:hypothetical protein